MTISQPIELPVTSVAVLFEPHMPTSQEPAPGTIELAAVKLVIPVLFTVADIGVVKMSGAVVAPCGRKQSEKLIPTTPALEFALPVTTPVTFWVVVVVRVTVLPNHARSEFAGNVE